MELRNDLMFSEPLYSDNRKGLLTLGESRIIQLVDGKYVELLPYLIDQHYSRGISKNDPRIRLNNNNAIELLAQPYADHYNNAGLDEHWTKEDAINMLQWHKGQSLSRYFFVKWARDIESQKEFPIGFFSVYTKPYHGGNMLWDGELFVLPEYRRHGIGTELIEAVLLTAAASGINLFEALTYKDENSHPYSMWEKYGASSTELIHISGEVNDMLAKINNSQEGKGRF